MKICQCGMPMNDAGEPLQAGDNHDYPCPKLLEQHPFLKRELNHLLGHGSYVFENCCDQEGSIFEKVMTVSGQVARTMIAEAIADRLPKEQSCFFSKTYLDIQPEDWMIPVNKEWVVFRTDQFDNVYGIYQHDFKTYVIRADFFRLEKQLRSDRLPNRLLFAFFTFAKIG